MFPLLSVVAGSASMIRILRDFNAPETEWVCETAADGTLGHQIPQLVHQSGRVYHVTQATRWRLGIYMQPLTWG